MTPIRLVVSSGHQQPDAAGLYLFDGSSVQPIDALPTSGLSVRGERLFRVAPYRQNDGTELLVYDARGICRYQRIDEIAGPHDVLALEDGRLLCVSPHFNAIFSIGTDGGVAPYWRADAPIDAWHINCLAERDGRLFATAFGRFESFRGWLPARDDATGLLFDLDSGEPVVTGLSYPHSPHWIDGAWVICDSGDNAVVRVEPNGSRVSVPVGGFSRGTCAIGEHVFVGVSTPRATRHDAGKGWISVLDRERWTEIERIPMPCSAMYDLIEVDETLLRSLQAGFRGSCERERYFGQLAMFEQVGAEPKRMWAVADPLPPQMCRVNITAALPAMLALGDVARVRCRIENAGDAFLVSAAPFPVEVCYRWFDAAGNAVGAGTWQHTRLPRALAPRDAVELIAVVAAPPQPGRFTLRLTLLQEGVQWFDDVDPANAVTQEIDVVERCALPC